jgi:hypothetical protein
LAVTPFAQSESPAKTLVATRFSQSELPPKNLE